VSVILILILASLGMALLFLGAFVWAAKSGQFEDTCTPAMRILAEEEDPRPILSIHPETKSKSK
jgi:cbb3-type cytochrome oxidase maturation protein